MITLEDKFATGQFQDFPEVDGVPAETNIRRIQVGDYPFSHAHPLYEPLTKVIITCPNGAELYYKLTNSQLTMLNNIITKGGWDATVQYEKPQDWQTF